LRSLDLFLRTEKMASCNFRRGLILFNLKKLAAISQNNAAFSTTARILGGHGPVSKYELHGGEKVHIPVGLGIGKREVVGYGNCGQENYVDHVHYPFPAIRFKEDDAEIAAIRKKELGDWKKITAHEKKVLYRASFCQTFAEMNAPTGEWKMITGMVLFCLGISMWMVIWCQKFVIPGGLRTLEPEYIKANVQRRIDYEMGPIEGLASKYDYEKNEWKK